MSAVGDNSALYHCRLLGLAFTAHTECASDKSAMGRFANYPYANFVASCADQ